MGRTYQKKEKHFNEVTIAKAIQDIEEENISVRAAGRRYGIAPATIKIRIVAKYEERIHKDCRGSKLMLSTETEAVILDLLKRMEALGMAPTLAEFGLILQEYLRINEEIQNGFTNNLPGRDWMRLFLFRHNMTLKKGGQMQLARRNVTSDPFVSSQDPVPSTSTGITAAVNLSGIQEQPPSSADLSVHDVNGADVSAVGSDGNGPPINKCSLNDLMIEMNKRAGPAYVITHCWTKVASHGTTIEEVLNDFFIKNVKL